MGLLSDAAKEQLATGTACLGFLAELEFRPGTERYWSGTAPLMWDGHVWTPTGQFGGASPMESSEDFRANGLVLTLAGLPVSAFASIDALDAAAYKGCRARFVIAVMNGGFTSVIHPIQRFFSIDTLDYAIEAETGLSITVGLEVETRRASRSKVRRYSPHDLEAEFPGDKAFEFVPYINSGVETKWGRGGAFFKNG